MSGTKAQSELELRAFKSYLDPLLSKHKTSALVTYEDLVASWQAAVACLGAASKEDSVALRDQIRALHQSQVDAYKVTAHEELQKWAEFWELPSIAESSTLEFYAKAARQLAEKNQPRWHHPDIAKSLATIEQRATQHFKDNEKESNEDVEEDDDEEKGEVTTDAEVVEEVTTEEDTNPQSKAGDGESPKGGKKAKMRGILAAKRGGAQKSSTNNPNASKRRKRTGGAGKGSNNNNTNNAKS